MFGYVKPNKMELKLKEISRYNDLYCGLCCSIRENYGQIYGCALSYDLTFLLTLLNGFSEERCEKIFRCPLNPLKKKKLCVSEKALSYAAFINYFLMYLKVNDDVIDDKQIWKKLLKIVMERNKNYITQYNNYSIVAEKLKNKMDAFNDLERKRTDFDELTNAFGEFFAEIFVGYFSEKKHANEVGLYKLCFNLGKWIYLMDAYDDYVRDQKHKKFNLISTMYFADNEPAEEQIQQRVQGIVCLLVSNMQKYLKELSDNDDFAIIENVILYGCSSQYFHIIQKRYPNYAKKISV